MPDSEFEDYPKSFIFFHITKTAGTTLKNIIRSQYRESEVYIFTPPFKEALQKFKEIPENDRMKLKALVGHNTYKLDSFMPQPCIYYTMLRNPIDRVISYYYYAGKTSTNPYYEDIKKGMTIIEYADKIKNTQNTAVAMSKGSENSVEAAKECLKNDTMRLGIVERFDESVLMLAKLLGWKKPPFYQRANVNKERPKMRAVAEEDIEALKEINRDDMEFYDFACELFDERVKALGEGFKSEVGEFQSQLEEFQRKSLESGEAGPSSFFKRLITASARVIGG